MVSDQKNHDILADEMGGGIDMQKGNAVCRIQIWMNNLT